MRAIQLPAEFIHHPKVIAKAASMPCLSFLDEVNRTFTEDRRRSLSYDMAAETSMDSFSTSFNSSGIVLEMETFNVSYNAIIEESISEPVEPPVVNVKELSFVEQVLSIASAFADLTVKSDFLVEI